MQKVAVFGLGSMGYGVARSLVRAGYETCGFDVCDEPVQRLVSEGGFSRPLQEVAPHLDTVVLVVLNEEQAESILFGSDPLAQHLKPGSVVISCTTVSPQFARDMAARCEEHDVHYLDGPISGGSKRALDGTLSVMASGSDAAFAAARPVLDAMAETVFELGAEAGAGSSMKAINQLLAGVHIAAMAEAITFGITQGVEAEKTVDVISRCAGTSWMFENRGPHIVAGDYTPHSSVNIWPKDLGIVLDIARQAGFGAPLTATALQQFLAAAGSGLGGEDDAAVAKVYARNAGVVLPGAK